MLLKELKERTSERHRALENDLRIEDRITNVAAYRALLERWYGWYAPWEAIAMTKAGSEVAAFLHGRRKTPLLESDLQVLEGGPLRELPHAQIREPEGVAEWVGALYVLEGSTLGGQVISRMVEEKLKLPAGRGCSFFRSYGDRVGLMWREFRNFAEQTVPPGDNGKAASAAEETYQSIHRWLCTNLQ